MISDKIKKTLEKQHYRLAGNHSAVQICRWTKNSLKGNGVCWKEKFYGIKSHQCCQMTPWIGCENKCIHCWRPIEMNLTPNDNLSDDPKEILDKIIEARKSLMIGLKGDYRISKKKFEEALKPTLFTFSLIGESTLYKRLPELIKEVRKRKAISFLVTNGLHPEMIKRLERENVLPTQITLSTNAPNKKLYDFWHNSSRKNAWKTFNKTLNIIRNLKGKTRRVIRLTLVKKGIKIGKFKNISNMKKEHVSQYAKLIRKSEPDFIHVKGFMSVGWSRNRIGYDKMPWHHEVLEFAKKLEKELEKEEYKILEQAERSCVVLLGKNKKMMKITNQ